MSALEQEIVERFHRLDKDAQRRVLTQLNAGSSAKFDLQSWLKRAEELRAEVRATQGANTRIDVVALLREVREDED